MIEDVVWAVPPGKKANARPKKLIEALVQIGQVSESVRTFFHGRDRSNDEESALGVAAPSLVLYRKLREEREDSSRRELSVLTPVAVPCRLLSRIWTDLYDDWSIARDISPVHRGYSAVTYEMVKRRGSGVPSLGVVTCNSEYMRRKLRLPTESLVPNGVDASLASLDTSGDGRRRLVILGHFMQHRTDYQLISRVVRLGQFDQVVIGEPGRSAQMRRTILGFDGKTDVVLRDWMTPEELTRYVGSRTVGFLPHLVNDYTMSQDAMKVYQFLALGMKVIAPRMLWPSHIGRENGLLLDFGINLRAALDEWVEIPGLTLTNRRKFADQNSWERRAEAIGELIMGEH